MPVYTTREAIKFELDTQASARMNGLIDRKIAAASLAIEELTLRYFYPWTGTRYVDWPNAQHARSWRLYLERPDQLVSLTSITSGGTALTVGDLNAEPDSGPPYSRLEVDLSSSATFEAGDSFQRSIAITGVWGYRDDSAAAGTVAEALDNSETGVDVTDSASIGIGSIIKVDSERMIVTGKTMLTTGQTLQTANLTASAANTTVNVTTGTAFTEREIIMIDSEKMLIDEIAGNALTVRRAWDGTALATHSTGTTIYAPRTLTVTRGALGTTAATHLTSATITRWVPPELIEELCVAETLAMLAQGSASWGRMVGTGEHARELRATGLKDLRERVMHRYGRRARVGAI